jgi:hypothetical protein
LSNTNTPWDLGELIILALDGSITAEQFAVLNDRLKKDAEARQYYREFVTTYIALHSSSGAAAAQKGPAEPVQPLDPRLWGALAEDESHAPGVPVSTGKTEPAETPNYTISRRTSKLPLYTALVAASLLLLLMSYVYVLPLLAPAGSFARLVAANGAKWAGDLSLKAGAAMPSEPIKLLEGTARLAVGKGAEITIEQNTEISIKSEKEVYLASGTFTASITDKESIGFSVVTPTAVVKDLGTEFVVTVGPDGRTSVTVIKGLVELTPLTGQPDTQVAQSLTAGQTGQVNPQGDMASSASAGSDPLAAFVVKDTDGEKEPKKKAEKDGPAKFIDLADILGGGNGLGANPRLVSVSMVDGAVRDGQVHRAETLSAGGYLRCPPPYIDGVFVPGAVRGPCVVSSAGTIFRECPVTSGMFSADVSTSSQTMDENGVAKKLYLQGRSWSPASSISMHSNSGITFDLAEMRAANPLIDLTMFSARCGLAFYDGQPTATGWINIYILVDGQKRFEKSLSAADEPEDVRVRLADKDRFLTLIVTDGTDGKLVNDNCLFIKPALHMRALRK